MHVIPPQKFSQKKISQSLRFCPFSIHQHAPQDLS
jgi:hypothetical protein